MMQYKYLKKRNFDIELRQKKFIMMGGEFKNVKQKLSEADIKKMKRQYIEMYYAFTSLNWASGKILGVSWQKAVEQMDSYVASKTKKTGHPMNAELLKFHRQRHRETAEAIMHNPYVNVKLLERHKEIFLRHGNKDLTKSKHALDDMYQQYMPTQEITKQPKIAEFGLANEQMMNNMLVFQRLRERAA